MFLAISPTWIVPYKPMPAACIMEHFSKFFENEEYSRPRGRVGWRVVHADDDREFEPYDDHVVEYSGKACRLVIASHYASITVTPKRVCTKIILFKTSKDFPVTGG